jgi:hypothetical protein
MNYAEDDVELAPGWPIAKVEKSLNEKDVSGLMEFLRSRHQNRFFDPIDRLKNAAGSHVGYGFSMMALCCLLVETFQCYREGVPTTSRREWGYLLDMQKKKSVPQEYELQGDAPPVNGETAFKNFFEQYSGNFPRLDGVSFYRYIRNGLLHQAQTKGGWKINIKVRSVWDPATKILNRNMFAGALKKGFATYLDELGKSAWTDLIWQNAARKIWWLIRLSR